MAAVVAVAAAGSACSSGSSAEQGLLEPREIASLDTEVGGLSLEDVTGGESGWLVVGSVTEPRRESATVALASRDGREWAPESLPAPDARAHRASVAATVGSDVVVLGTAEVGRDQHVVMWTGRPGGDWDLVGLEDLGRHRSVSVSEGIAVGDGAVFVGEVLGEDGHWVPRVWRVDGDRDVTLAEGFDGLEGSLATVASDGDRLMAGGAMGEPGAYRPPELFTSSDEGRTWERLDHDGLDQATIYDISYLSGSWWIGGTVAGAATGRAEMWTSPDAVSWTTILREEGLGSSHVGEVVEVDGQLAGLGTGVFSPERGGWAMLWWPGAGERGWFGAAATYDGMLVAVGGTENAHPGLYTTTNPSNTYATEVPDAWRRVEVAGQVLDPATGVGARPLDAVAGSPQRLVVVGEEATVEGETAQVESFAAASPDFARARGPARFDGGINDVAHVEGLGFVAAAAHRRDHEMYHGAHVLISRDGQDWETAASTDGDEDRAFTVVALDGHALVTGMTWNDDATRPSTLLWRVTPDGTDAVTATGLDGRGAVDGCGRGDTVALVVTSGRSSQELAVSTDTGATFTLHSDGPIQEAGDMACAAGPDGRIAVLVTDRARPELHTLDPRTGRWDTVELPDVPRLQLGNVQHLPRLGWLLTGSRGGDENSHAVAYLSRGRNPGPFTALDIATNDDSSIHDAAISDNQLHLIGTQQGQPTIWATPLDQIPNPQR